MNSNLLGGGLFSHSHHSSILKIIVTVLIVSAIIIIIVLEYKKHKKKTNSCDSINKTYNSKNKIVVNGGGVEADIALKDVAIMGSYNSCATDNLCNSYVNLCALKLWLKTGIRALDFEIYSSNNRPVVAVSNDDSYCLKQSYNHIDLNEVMQTISQLAFAKSPTGPNNSTDPLFINLRIKSSNSTLFENVYTSINSYLGKYLATNQAVKPSIFTKYNPDDMPILNTKMNDLESKVIIIFDMTTMVKNNSNLNKISPNLAKIINIYVPSARLDKINKLSKAEHINFKILIPNLSCSSMNISSSSKNTSITDKQLNIAFMSFQSYDNNLLSYLKKFSATSDSYFSMINLKDWSNNIENPLDSKNCNFTQKMKDKFKF